MKAPNEQSDNEKKKNHFPVDRITMRFANEKPKIPLKDNHNLNGTDLLPSFEY